MRYWKGILLLSFSVLSVQVFPQSYNFRNFSSEDGLVQSYIYSITQDINGYLWVGTGNGLSRYNGFKFENYTTSDSLADNFITCGTSDGKCMWFGHMNGGLSVFNGKRFHTVKMQQKDISRITHFAKSPDGRIWASTYSDGLLRIERDSGVVKHYFFKDQSFITTFEFLDDNELLIGGNTGLLYCRLNKSGEINIIRPVTEVPGSKITCIQRIKTKTGFYIATENDGLFRLTDEYKPFKVSKVIINPDCNLTGIQDIYEDNQSDLWLGSFGNGLIRLINSSTGEFTKFIYFNKATKFITDNVKTVFGDREGIIWSGNAGEGLSQITSKTFSIRTFDRNLYGNDIFSIWLSRSFRWVGTENGLIKMDPVTDKIIKFYSKGSGLPKDTVTALYSTDEKELWIGTEKNGLFRMKAENEKIIKYPIGSGELENSVTNITGKGNQVWIGTKKGLCNINSDNNRINWYTINHGGLPHNYINCLYLDRTGKLWVSTRSNIIAYILDEKVFKIALNSNSRSFTIGPVTEDADSRIWVGSNGDGVFMIGPDSIANLTEKEGLLSDYCYSMICDDQKNIWIGHRNGLSRIKTTDFSVKPLLHIEGIAESCQFNPNAIIEDQQEKIWFGSDKGLILYDPSLEDLHLQPPVLGITSIKINNDEADIADKIILSPGNYKIRINFLGISLKEPSLVNYQYKLEGYDQWSDITKNPSVTYNHLTEGTYRFTLKASSGDGAVTENPLILTIILKKAIWKKWWFYLIAVVLIFILTLIYLKRRIHKFQTEKTILEEKVLERTQEIQFQKNEIMLQKDLIDETNASITSSIRYASHIQKAVLPPIEFINKLFPDNFILSKPKDIVSGDFYWLGEKNNKIVFTVADCTGHGVPGAFMSLLGITLLNEIVNIQGITDSDTIVNMLRERVIRCLQQSRKEIPTSDGMDIALCVMDKLRKKIQFTGGMSDLIYIRDKKLEVLKADRLSVCALGNTKGSFTGQVFDYKEGDVLYLFSDGFQDQFGGEHDKKYLRHQFYISLTEIHELPMQNQREVLEMKFSEWMKDYVQTDDITVMGIRL